MPILTVNAFKYITSLIGLSLAVLFYPTYVSADNFTRRDVSEWNLTQSFGTPRLLLKSALKNKNAEAGQYVGALASNVSIGPDVMFLEPRPYFAVQPQVLYENNINGGLPFNSINVGPFDFEVDEGSRAKNGLTFGGRISSGVEIPLAQGLLFSSSAQIGARRSAKYNIDVFEYSYGACLKYTSDYWTYFDSCLARTYIERELSKEERDFAIISFGKIFESDLGIHDVSMSFTRQDYLNHHQNQLRLSSKSIIENFGVLDVGVSIFESVDGVFLPVFGVNMAYGTIVYGKRMQWSLSYLEEDGGSVFGMERADSRWILKASRSVSKSTQVFATFERKVSSIEEFSEDVFGFGVEYFGLRW